MKIKSFDIFMSRSNIYKKSIPLPSVFDTFRNRSKFSPPNKPTTRERKRLRQREKFVNKTAPEYTGELQINGWSDKKGKALYKVTTDFVNINRLTRKEMTPEERKEYIEKNKEFSLFYTDKYRKEVKFEKEMENCYNSVIESASLLPQVLGVEVEYGYPYEFFNEENIIEVPLVNNLEFSEEYLYLEQKLMVMSDEARSVIKASYNTRFEEDEELLEKSKERNKAKEKSLTEIDDAEKEAMEQQQSLQKMRRKNNPRIHDEDDDKLRYVDNPVFEATRKSILQVKKMLDKI